MHGPGLRAAGDANRAELNARPHQFVVESYQHRMHGVTGMASQARWETGGFLPCLSESAENHDLLLLTVPAARRVHRDGIHFQGLRCLDLTLAAYVGEWVTIRYDPRDLAEVQVFTADGFLCRTICPELAGAEIGLKDLVHARDARRRDLQAGLANRTTLVERLLGVQTETPTPSLEGGAATGGDAAETVRQ